MRTVISNCVCTHQTQKRHGFHWCRWCMDAWRPSASGVRVNPCNPWRFVVLLIRNYLCPRV